MKFGQSLAAERVDEWIEHYVQYDELKRLIKRIDSSPSSSSSSCSSLSALISPSISSSVSLSSLSSYLLEHPDLSASATPTSSLLGGSGGSGDGGSVSASSSSSSLAPILQDQHQHQHQHHHSDHHHPDLQQQQQQQQPYHSIQYGNSIQLEHTRHQQSLFFALLDKNMIACDQFVTSEMKQLADNKDSLFGQAQELANTFPSHRDPKLIQFTKENLVALYSRAHLLRNNLLQLNYTAVFKILKKFEKNFGWDPQITGFSTQQQFIKNKVHSLHAFSVCSFELVTMLKDIETMYANAFEDGDLNLAANRLHKQAKARKLRGDSIRNIKNKKGFIIDMDGTLYKDGKLLPGALEFVQWLKSEGKYFLFLTNSSDKTQLDIVKKLARMGIDVSIENVFTSAMATSRWLHSQNEGGSAYVIGESGLFHALYEIGFTITDVDPDFVVVGESSNYNFEKIQTAVQCVLKGARLITTHADIYDPSARGPIPAAGALSMHLLPSLSKTVPSQQQQQQQHNPLICRAVAPIEMICGRKAYSIGKPNPIMMRSALRVLKVPAEDAVIIGDRMDTDIISGLESEIDTVLVLSGVTTKDSMNAFSFRPHWVIGGLQELFSIVQDPTSLSTSFISNSTSSSSASSMNIPQSMSGPSST